MTDGLLQSLAEARGQEPEARSDASAEPASQPEGAEVSKQEEDTGHQEAVEGELYVKGGADQQAIDMNDARQGGLGDCYFIALLAAIARVRPDILQDMVTDHGDGTYTVTFQIERWFGGYKGKSVKVDNKFWYNGSKDEGTTGGPLYAKEGDSGAGGPELWVMIIEKAWAKLHGGYSEIEGGTVDTDARSALTGHEADTIDPAKMSDATLLEALKTHFVDGSKPVVFNSKGDKKHISTKDVVANHAYSLKEIDVASGTVDLYNPWGIKHLDDLGMTDVKGAFASIKLVNVSDP